MHRIIHLSPVGCFTPARGKTVQKNRQVSGVKAMQLLGGLQRAEWQYSCCRHSYIHRMRNNAPLVDLPISSFIIFYSLETRMVGNTVHCSREALTARNTSLFTWGSYGEEHCSLFTWGPCGEEHCSLFTWGPYGEDHCSLEVRMVRNTVHCSLEARTVRNTVHCSPEARTVRNTVHCSLEARTVRNTAHCSLEARTVRYTVHCSLAARTVRNTVHCSLEARTVRNTVMQLNYNKQVTAYKT